MILQTILSFIFLPLSLLLQLALGRMVYQLSPFSDKKMSDAVLYLLGLLVHLATAFFLRCLSIPLPIAAALPFIATFFPASAIRKRYALPHVRISMNYMVWMSVHLAIGVSLFQVTDGIVTAWRNNYGDLAFHLGMISSFVFGKAGVPEFHLFPGTILSYPFFINFWSALHFQVAPTWYMLSVIFLFQWCVLWSLVYQFLNGDRNILLPWAILLGGGSYFVLGTDANSVSNEKAPFSIFITTIWVTQRSAMYGAAVMLCVLKLVFGWINDREDKDLVLAICILMLSPLVHAHLLLTLGIYLCFLALTLILFGQVRIPEVLDVLKKYWRYLFCYFLPGVILSIWLLQKKSLIKIIYGWYGRGDSAINQIFSSAGMWLKCGFPVLVALYLLWICTRKHAYFIPLVITFLIANIVQISIWEWDQLKIFLGLYIIFIFLWTQLRDQELRYLQGVLLLLMAPALYDLSQDFARGENFTVYTRRDLDQAQVIREVTPVGAVIAASPKHNSLVTLTGRSIYAGYDGTLFSHGIDYKSRRDINDNFDDLMKCPEREEICPDYLLFTDDEKRLWKRQRVQNGVVRPTGLPYLYRLLYR